MEYREFGQTGMRLSAVALGGFANGFSGFAVGFFVCSGLHADEAPELAEYLVRRYSRGVAAGGRLDCGHR